MTIFSSRLNLNTTVTFIWRSGLINFVTIIFTDIISSWVVLIVTFVVDTIISIFFGASTLICGLLSFVSISIFISTFSLLLLPLLYCHSLLARHLSQGCSHYYDQYHFHKHFSIFISPSACFSTVFDFVNNIDILV